MHDHEHMQEHDHVHQHSYVHSHAHEHQPGHEQEHGHEHVHSHDHAHTAGSGAPLSQTEAIMRYTLEHNRHHADELHDLAHQLSAAGKPQAAAFLHQALERFSAGNDLLEQAVQTLQSQV